MNKSGKANLTWTLIGMAIFITVITISYSTYTQFLADNTGTINELYTGYYENLSSTQGSINIVAGDVSDKSLIFKIWTAAGALVTVFVRGLGAIDKFLDMIPIVNEIINVIELAIPGFGALLGLVILIATVWISVKLIQAARGTGSEA